MGLFSRSKRSDEDIKNDTKEKLHQHQSALASADFNDFASSRTSDLKRI